MLCAPFLALIWELLSIAFLPCGLALNLRSSLTRMDEEPTRLPNIELLSGKSSWNGAYYSEANLELAARDAFVSDQWQKMRTRQRPWKVKWQIGNKDRNICIGGKHVPDFYVLGVQKCATSSLAKNLMEAGMRNVHGDLNPKEFHWFDQRMNYSQRGNDGWVANQKAWLSWMPECPLGGTRQTLADFTPDYLRIVPRPQEFEFAAERDWKKVQVLDLTGPQEMFKMYGEIHARKLNFAVMFREPLSQMQSAWYHAASFNFTNACKSCRASSFKAALKNNLNGLQKMPPQLTPWQWTTMYARQLEPWLRHFNASQFYIIPMKQLAGDKKDNICKDLAGRLDFQVECDSDGVESEHSWSHEHPSVDEDAGPEMRQMFDDFMLSENNALVRLLAKGHVQGMGLANYEGVKGDEDQISKWLLGSW